MVTSSCILKHVKYQICVTNTIFIFQTTFLHTQYVTFYLTNIINTNIYNIKYISIHTLYINYYINTIVFIIVAINYINT